MWLVLTLLLPLSLSLGYKVEPGCDDWTLDPSSSNQVCCNKCKPGNRLVSQCGSNTKALCEPCENGTYAATLTALFCKRCTECISPLRMKKPCNAYTDTVCECVQGFLCGDKSCSFCVQECGKGEEPTENRGCRPCPAGTFNSQIHHHCVNWSSSCPSPDQQITAPGTAFSDIVCADRKPTMPTPDVKPSEISPNKIPPKTDNKKPGIMLVMAIICACLIISSAMPLCVAMFFKKEKTEKKPPKPVETPVGRRLVPEPEQCSFCFPQEERGSHSSLLLDDKPFELVV
ncbi:tumor necrosis factor receptor superfamily member 9b isoform X2 [Pangasianodon hypophthalmus]|uniref:tumor necrosis factor receptor superfamily member 9b isoform X2 n=1 Tax=Pangasianodon hypophthalmus TaxID=310915 RepID=UPI0023077A0E|nr:tumor necrosis factor receptor superfamily member 9b isoform X2 [Pangasianodon hypophthalmus]